MIYSDLINILQWWIMLFIIGSMFLPLTSAVFSKFYDRGYIFSKILGISITSYLIFLLATIKLVAFSRLNSLFILIFFLLLFLLLNRLNKNLLIKNFIAVFRNKWKVFLLEELIFLLLLLFWSFIRAHQPDIHNIEKFMDFGFVNSILRSDYFPPKDMWFANFTINYYYYGHLVTAILTKISGINSSIAYNLMLASIFSFIFTQSFSIGLNLLLQIKKMSLKKALLGSLLTAFLVTLSGNLQTIYAFFVSYKGDNPIPFWQLAFSPQTFPNAYWYPSATRFIYHTIHEFPSYALALSDLHGHLLDTPFTIFAIALTFSIFLKLKSKELKLDSLNLNFSLIYLLLLGLLLAIMYMTNAWDGLIYLLLTVTLIGVLALKKRSWQSFLKPMLALGVLLFIFTLPFNLSYQPPVSGLGVLCPPQFLIGENIGPLIFENQCQRSPIWTLVILYGFFYFWAISFLAFILNRIKNKTQEFNLSDNFILILILCASFFILIPELIYFKDIFTTYPRANTMFKIAYQVFIILSLSSGYIIIRLSGEIKTFIRKSAIKKLALFFYLLFALCIFFLVSIYPIFAINSYYNGLNHYYGLDGINYLKELYPSDYDAISWINKNIKGQPTILEAQGDSYTDYERLSINTGLPTVIGWTVHEWFWRNNYDVVASRISDVKTIYETNSLILARNLIHKYNVSYVFIGVLERQKYINLKEDKFKKLGKAVFESGGARLYKINP
jgi:uncharacterized membrane protein